MFSKTISKEVKDFIVFVILTIAIVIPIRMFVAQPFIVSGASMYPTFDTGQYLIVDQVTYKMGEPERGDVIVFKYPNDTSKYFIKRIIGLPNEEILIDNKVVTVKKDGGQKSIVLQEPYILLEKNDSLSIKLAGDEYFVMGDNRSASLDSRIWGPLKKEFIIGRAVIRLTPVDEIGILPGKFNF